MKWNLRVYEEPGILFADQTAEVEEPFATAQELMKPGVEDGRKLLALLTNVDTQAEPQLCPPGEPCNDSFDQLAERVTQLLTAGEPFAAARLCDGALQGANGHDPEVKLLVASVYEHISFYDMAIPLLRQVGEAFEDSVRRSALQIRLARALRRSGRQEDVSEMLEGPLQNPELPPLLRAEGLLLRAMGEERESALETLDELLDYAEEHLGDHRLVADALELHADILSDVDRQKAEQFYLAAGKMLVSLKDPYFFSLNERFVVHFLKHQAFHEALSLCHEMFEMLKQAGGPPVAAIPYFVFAAHAHKVTGDQDRSAAARKTAHEIHPVEATRIEQMLAEILRERVIN